MELFDTQTAVKVQLVSRNLMPAKSTELLFIATTASQSKPCPVIVLGHAEPNYFCPCSGVNQQPHSEVKGV